MPLHILRRWADSAEVVIVADGAADRLLAADFKPHQIVGDFDTVSEKALRGGALLVRDPGQDSTDCDKLLRLARAGSYVDVTLVSVEGDLPDHELATMQSALKVDLQVRLAYRRGIAWILRQNTSLKVSCGVGARVSLLPLENNVRATLTGVEWPLNHSLLDPKSFSSISNRAAQTTIGASLSEGSGFLFVEYPPEELPFW